MPLPRSQARQHATPVGHRGRRRGAVALLGIWALVVFLLIAAWVLNYNYLALVNRNMQQKSDAIVLAAAPELLDEDRLRDYPGPPIADQTDDLAEARAVADEYRRLNNRAQSPALCLAEGDMIVETDCTVPASQNGFIVQIRPWTMGPSDDPCDDTLRVCCRRLATGDHPVRMLLGLLGCGNLGAATIQTTSSATLDNLLIGFRPTPAAASPVMPLAISVAPWFNERMGGDDLNGNGIREMVLRLDSPLDDPATDANCALLFFDGTADPSVLAPQIAAGLTPSDLPPNGTLGPVTPSAPRWTQAIRQIDATAYPNLSDDLAHQINQLAAAADARRVFPLFDAMTDPGQATGEVRLVGFVAASILGAAVDNDRLTVLIEPCFLIHTTCWTVPANDPSAPARNTFIHKLRLTH